MRLTFAFLLLLAAGPLTARAEGPAKTYPLRIKAVIDKCTRNKDLEGTVSCVPTGFDTWVETPFHLGRCLGRYEFYQGPACLGDWQAELKVDGVSYDFYVRVAEHPKDSETSHRLYYSIRRHAAERIVTSGSAEIARGAGALAGAIKLTAPPVVLTDSGGEASIYHASLQVAPTAVTNK